MTIKRVPLKKKFYTIPKYSKKRKKQVEEYNALIKKRDENSAVHYCFFCGLKITGAISHHHLLSRREDALLDDEMLVDAHNEHHLDFHNKSVHLLSKEVWWLSFLERLKEKCPEAHQKVLNKFNK